MFGLFKPSNDIKYRAVRLVDGKYYLQAYSINHDQVTVTVHGYVSHGKNNYLWRDITDPRTITYCGYTTLSSLKNDKAAFFPYEVIENAKNPNT